MKKRAAIICVDDDMGILQCLVDELEYTYPRTYAIEMAESAEEALELIADMMADGHPIAVVISDFQIGDSNGDVLLHQILQQSPETRTVILSGYDESEVRQMCEYPLAFHYALSKPWGQERLAEVIGKALNGHQSPNATIS
jgi:DNA-binding NtrC family response regulator